MGISQSNNIDEAANNIMKDKSFSQKHAKLRYSRGSVFVDFIQDFEIPSFGGCAGARDISQDDIEKEEEVLKGMHYRGLSTSVDVIGPREPMDIEGDHSFRSGVNNNKERGSSPFVLAAGHRNFTGRNET